MNSLQLKQLIREALTEVKKAKKSKHEKGETKAQEKKEHTSGKEKKEKSEKTAPKKMAPKTEAKPKSTGKLVDLKKEKDALKAMKEALGKYMVNEGESEAQLEAAFAHQQSYINEMAKIEEMTANLAEKMNSDLSLVEEKIKAETAKIKEMMGVANGEKKTNEARFKKGEDVGSKGKNFAKIEKSAAKKYGSEEAGKKVAGAILKKVVKK